MKANYELCLSGDNVILVPYRPEHLLTYHTWMQDTVLCELTASTPLTMEQEIAMQAEWRDDDTKCTFIILARNLLGTDHNDAQEVPPPPPPPSSKIEEGSVNRNIFPSLVGTTLNAMIGDVNLFLSDVIDDDNEEEKVPPSSTFYRQAEIDVMIAVPSHRCKNIGAEVAFMAMRYGASQLNVSRFFAKIHETNAPSLRLFEKKIGFERCGYTQCFGEHELECRRNTPGEMRTWVEETWREWRGETSSDVMYIVGHCPL